VSPLTKVFVMLLVVCSLLNAAAIVVYVNKSQATDEQYTELSAKNRALMQDKQQAIADAATARAQLLAQQQVAASEAAAKQAALDKGNADIAAKDADNKQLLRNFQAQEANLQGLNAQLAIALETNKQQTQTVNDLRDYSSKLVQGQAENDAAVARQRQLAETYGRQVEYLTEQQKKSQDLIKAYSAVIQENHLTLPQQTSSAGSVSFTGNPISGTVQDKQVINGVTYVNISVGSADSVQTGMEFRVVDASAQPPQFLGIVTITRTEPNSAIGRLQAEAPSVARVSKGDEVTSDVR